MVIRAARFVFLAWATVLAGIGPLALGRLAAADEGYPVATDVRLGGDAKSTRLVFDLSRGVPVNAFLLADPYRVVVDLPQIAFHLPRNAGEHGRGLVKAFRYGLVMKGGSRIVVDLAGPARIEKAFALPAAAGQPARLVLHLTATTRETFLHTVAIENRIARTPPTRKPAPIAPNRDPRPVIVLDPGHGGIDEGTHSGPTAEKEIVLGFAKQLRHQLQKSGRYQVLMTRADDTYVPLGERVQFARVHHAALFISIHADALPRKEGDARGASIYTLSDTASDAEAARLADAENRADVIAGVDLSSEPNEVADILIDLAQRETHSFSVHFARSLATELKSVTRLHKNPLKAAGFVVLKAPDVPSVLIELGYVSNPKDLKELTSESWRAHTAEAMTQAIDGYFLTRLAGTTGSVHAHE